MSNPRSPQAAAVRHLVEPVVGDAGFDVEDVSVSQAGRRSVVRVIVDGDDGVSLDDVAELSTAISAALDQAADAVPATAYTLEVTSPGVDRPLTLPRHWRRNTDRLVKVRVGEEELTGRVVGTDSDSISLDVDGAVRQVPFGELGPGSVQIEFNRKEG